MIDPHDCALLRLHIRWLPLRPVDREFLSLSLPRSLFNLTMHQYTGESPINTPWIGLKRLVHPSRQGVKEAFWGEEMMQKRNEKKQGNGKNGVDGKV